MNFFMLKKRFLLSQAHKRAASLMYVPDALDESEYMVAGIGSITNGTIAPAAIYTNESGNTFQVTHINQQAFAGNCRVKQVEIPESITVIGFAAFDSCENLSSLYFHERCRATLGMGCFNKCSALEQVTVPALITDVGDSVFRECQKLEKATVYSAIGTRMFYGCKSLKEVFIGDDVTVISERAFSECSALATVRMGKNVQKICKQAFYRTALKEIDFSEHNFVPELENAYAFKGIERIIVPEHLYDEWSDAPEWRRHAEKNRIVSGAFRYVSLGDSIAAGHAIDDNWETDYGVRSQYGEGEEGNLSTRIVPGSYTDLIAQELSGRYASASTTSFAHSGDTVEDLIRYMLPDNPSSEVVRAAIEQASLVTICIGANDILGPALEIIEQYASDGDLTELAETVSGNLAKLRDDEYDFSYTALLNELNSINAKAQYVFTTVYNPYKYLWLEEGENGFFKPVLDSIPQITILGIEVDEIIRKELLGTREVRTLFERVNKVGAWAEPYINELNQILKTKTARYSNAHVADTKLLFESIPDRPIGANAHYNDLVNVEYTRGYDTAKMDWGALWEGSNASTFWFNLVTKYVSSSGFDIDGFAKDLVQQMIEKVIFPDIDPHPEAYGHYVLKRSLQDALGKDPLVRYDIIYDTNEGATGSMEKQTVVGLDSAVFAIVKPYEFSPAEGYYFTGWGDNVAYANGYYYAWVNAETTLHAQWSNLYSVNFYKDLNTYAKNVYSNYNGGLTNQTGHQELYGVNRRIGDEGGYQDVLFDTKYYRGKFGDGKKLISSVKLEYGAKLVVWVTYDHDIEWKGIVPPKYQKTTSNVTLNGETKRTGYEKEETEYLIAVNKNTDITFECVLSGTVYVDATSHWNCHITQ